MFLLVLLVQIWNTTILLRKKHEESNIFPGKTMVFLGFALFCFFMFFSFGAPGYIPFAQIFHDLPGFCFIESDFWVLGWPFLAFWGLFSCFPDFSRPLY